MSHNDDYVYDEESGEWMPASELAARQADRLRQDLMVFGLLFICHGDSPFYLAINEVCMHELSAEVSSRHGHSIAPR